MSRRHDCAPMVYLDNVRLTHFPDRNAARAIAVAGEAVNMANAQ